MASNILDLWHINVRSLNDSQMDSIRAELSLEYDVICLSETNLPTAKVSDLSLSGFHSIIRKDRIGKSGGGVALYAANFLGVMRMAEFEIPELEAMWVKVKAGNDIALICVCYKPPNAKADFWTKLQDSIDLAKQSGIEKIIITGDMNSDPKTREGYNLKLFTQSNNFTTHVNEPTRITPNSATILDQFISNLPLSLKNVEVLDPIGSCDHCVIRATLHFKNKFNKPKCYKRHIWQYKLADMEEFKHKLNSADWDHCFSDDINESCNKWTSTFLNIARECIPNKVVTIRPCDKLFFSPELRQLRRKKNRLHKNAKKYNTLYHWTCFREARNAYNSKIKEAKANAEIKHSEELLDYSNIFPKKWWKIAKYFIK